MGGSQHSCHVAVDISKYYNGLRVNLSKLKTLVSGICCRFGLANVEVSIAIVGDLQMKRLNKRFLNRDGTTDCMSFDLSGQCQKVFEVVVNGQMAKRQAGLRGHSGEAELALYVTHGMLHNLGYDDSTRSQGESMHSVEDEILEEHGFGRVYDKLANHS